jgi:glycosyltransferase involved in cell wall biosynthesis
VIVPEGMRYGGDLARGIVVVNGMPRRQRRVGADIFARVRESIPLDLVGMEATEMGGLGEVRLPDLPAFEARYRFFFNPIRYTSLGLAVCEAMMIGMPIIGMATTEMVTVIENGTNGYIDTRVEPLIERMRALLDDPAEARRLGEGARRTAEERFNIARFARDWDAAFRLVTNTNMNKRVYALSGAGRTGGKG